MIVGSECHSEILILFPKCLLVAYSFSYSLFVHPLSHTCRIGQVNYSLYFIYYNTTYNKWTSTQYNIINNNTKFKGHLDVESITTFRCISFV